MWDLCNEPQASALNSTRSARIRLPPGRRPRPCAGGEQPITIGPMNGGNVEIFAPLCDEHCGHAYQQTRRTETSSGATSQAERGTAKPFLVNECIPGALDDPGGPSRALLRARFSEAGFGCMGWARGPGRSTRRDRMTTTASTAKASIPSSPARERCAAGWSS